MESYDFLLDDEVMSKINALTRKPLGKEKVYAFPIILCDNEIDRDGERFSKEAIEKLTSMFIGRTGIFDHDPKGRNQTARIFDAFVDEPEGRLTSYGEQYVCLAARAYMVRNDANKALIEEIDAGIKKEVSISCSVAKKVCSICGKDIYKEHCSHIKGKSYSGKKCFVSLEEPTDAYEWSFVAIPAQVDAGVRKTFGRAEKAGTGEKPDKKKLDEYFLMHDALIKKVKALYELSGAKNDAILGIADKLEVSELLELEKEMTKQLTKASHPQLEAKKDENKNYKA